MEEIWLPIEGMPGPRREVSNLGRVRQKVMIIKGHEFYNRIIKPSTKGRVHGMIYFRTGNRVRWRTVRLLVADAFVENPHGYRFVGYKDPDLENPDVASNLEWVETCQSGPVSSAYIKERNKRIVSMLNDGRSVADVAGIFQLSEALIYKVRRKCSN